METKKCTKCNEVKLLYLFPNYKKRNGEYGKLGDCKCCKKNIKNKWILENKQKVKEQSRKAAAIYRKKNPNKVNEWRLKNKDKQLCLSKKAGAKSRNKLSDSYIVGLIANSGGVTRREIMRFPELIEIKRIIIKTKRLCKTSQI